MMYDLISIIVPVYNAADYLSDCLESLVGQTHANLQIVVVDDGSSDDSGKTADDFADRDSRITVIHQDNAGVSAARNAGLNHVTGDYLMFVDGDDWLDPEACTSALEIMRKHDADVVVFDYFREFGNRSEAKNIFKDDLIEFDELQVSNRLHRRLVGLADEELTTPENADAISPVWGKLYKTSLVKDMTFVDLAKIGSYEDGLVNLQVFALVKRAVYLRSPWYHYRKTSGTSLTSKYRSELSTQWMLLFEMINAELQRQQVDNSYFKALNNRIALSIIGLGLNECANPNGHLARINKLKEILSCTAYREAYRRLPLRYFPMHWKLFFGLAKINCASGVYILSLLISKKIGR